MTAVAEAREVAATARAARAWEALAHAERRTGKPARTLSRKSRMEPSSATSIGKDHVPG